MNKKERKRIKKQATLEAYLAQQHTAEQEIEISIEPSKTSYEQISESISKWVVGIVSVVVLLFFIAFIVGIFAS